MSKGCRRDVKKAYIRIANRWQKGCRKDNKTTLLNPFQSDPSAIHNALLSGHSPFGKNITECFEGSVDQLQPDVGGLPFPDGQML